MPQGGPHELTPSPPAGALPQALEAAKEAKMLPPAAPTKMRRKKPQTNGSQTNGRDRQA